MKKFISLIFWLTIIGGGYFFYKKNPQIKEYCNLIMTKIGELIEQHHCCSHNDNSEEEVED